MNSTISEYDGGLDVTSFYENLAKTEKTGCMGTLAMVALYLWAFGLGFHICCIPFLLPLNAVMVYVFNAKGISNERQFLQISTLLVLSALAIVLAAVLYAVSTKRAFRYRYSRNLGLSDYYSWAAGKLDEFSAHLRTFLEPGEVQRAVIVCCKAPEGEPALAAVMLIMHFLLVPCVSVAALTTTGEGLIVTLCFAFFSLALLALYLSPRIHYLYAVVVVEAFIVTAIIHVLLPFSLKIKILFDLSQLVMGGVILKRARRDYARERRAFFLVVGDRSKLLVEPDPTRGLRARKLARTAVLKPLLTFDGFKTRLQFDDGSCESIIIQSRAELEHLEQTDNKMFSTFSSKGHLAPTGSLAGEFRPLLAAGSFIAWFFVYFIVIGLSLGLLILDNLSSWLDCRPHDLLAGARIASYAAPISASVYTFRALSAADSQKYDEALYSYRKARYLSCGIGQCGELSQTLEKANFPLFCKDASRLHTELDALRAPAGIDEKVYRDYQYALRYTDLVLKHGPACIQTHRPIIMEHLLSAWESSQHRYVKAGVALVKLLCYMEDFRRIPQANQESHFEEWNETAGKVLELLKGKVDPRQFRRLSARYYVHAEKYEKAAASLAGSKAPDDRLLLASILRFHGNDLTRAFSTAAGLAGNKKYSGSAKLVMALILAQKKEPAKARRLLSEIDGDKAFASCVKLIDMLIAFQCRNDPLPDPLKIKAALKKSDFLSQHSFEGLPWPEVVLRPDLDFISGIIQIADRSKTVSKPGAFPTAKKTGREKTRIKSLERLGNLKWYPFAGRARELADEYNENDKKH